MSQAGLLHVTDSVLPPDVPLIFQGNSGSGSAVGNVFEILGAGVATTSVVGNVMTITVVSSGFTWNVVTSAMNPVTLVKENGYIAKGAGVIQFVLPAAAAIGDTFWIKGYGNLWTLQQNAGQFVTIGNSTSTPGVFGSISASMISDAVELLCVTANTEFTELGIQGNPFIV